MKRWLGVSFVVASLFVAGCGSDAGPGSSQEPAVSSSNAALGALLHEYARPDARLCPSPACGGYWLVDAGHHSACHDERSTLYVTGIYAGDQRISPRCGELLTGFLRPDPRDPRYDIFELEL